MKKVISITLALIMALSLSVTAFAATITAKTPSKDSNGVYQIGTAAELYGFAQLVNNGQTSIKAVLTADIVVNQNVLNESGELNSGDFASWTPIGSSSQYKGTFDGQGHTISGLYCKKSSTDYVGLFGSVSDGGGISNVGVVDSYIYGNTIVGGVCGNNYGTITACYNAGTINGASNHVGGVCGYNGGTIIDCYNTGTVSGTSYNVGGVCGYNIINATITDCYNTGTVSGNDDVGGVCGNSYYGKITGCYNTGVVSGIYSVGGVCGCNGTNAAITACYNTGTVSGTSDVGGVCGNDGSKSTIADCYNTGKVSGTSNVGGVCGIDSSSSYTITDCYNTGEVSGTSKYVGGVCGYNQCAITGCYNSGMISGTEESIGGVCGYNYSGTVSASYNMGTVSGGEYIGGVCGYNNGAKSTITCCYANSGEVYGYNNVGTVTDCAIYSDDKFADGTVLNLLNKALEDAGSSVVFYQLIGSDPYPVLTDNSKRSTNVEYTVAETYTVTIPSAVTLGSEAKISASDVVLKKGRQVNVALTGTSGASNAFTVTSGEGAVLEYTVNDGDVKVGSTVLTVNPTNGNSGSATLSFSEPAEKKFSGSYSGTVTFTVSVG